MEIQYKPMGDWIPLMDYAMKRGVSLSTLRRHIKANKIRYKVEDGRYLLFDETGANESVADSENKMLRNSTGTGAVSAKDETNVALNARVEQLERELHKAQEEIAELKMLVAIYEEKIPRFDS